MFFFSFRPYFHFYAMPPFFVPCKEILSLSLSILQHQKIGFCYKYMRFMFMLMT